MRWSFPELRRLLSKLGDPSEVERSPLALELKDALGTDSARDAVLHVVYKTFDGSSPQNRLSRDAILMPALGGDKGTLAASVLNVSLRTFFRRRTAAMKMVATTIEQVLRAANPRVAFKLETARMVSEVRPDLVEQIIEREGHRSGGMAAYQSVLVSLRGGRMPSLAMLNRCTGHWRLLAELELARTENLSGENPLDYQRVRTAVRSSLSELRGAARERVEFELAYVDRLDSIRRCDVDMGAQATAVLGKSSGQDLRLRAIASICRAEQACDEGRVAAAAGIVRDMQDLSVRLNDLRVAGRTSHVASIVSLLQGNYADAADWSRFTLGALYHIEPTFSPCASAIEGRARFFLDRGWDAPRSVVKRFHSSYVTSFLETVYARYLAISEPRRALALVDNAAAVSESREARGTLLYAEGTRAIVLERLGSSAAAQAERVRAWSNGVRLRRPFYLYDLMVHPSLPVRAFGAFELDDNFLSAIERRLLDLITLAGARQAYGAAVRPAVAACLSSAAADGSRERLTLARRQSATGTAQMRRVTRREKEKVHDAFRHLSSDLSYCLPIEGRSSFVKRFCEAASDMLGVAGAERSVAIGA